MSVYIKGSPPERYDRSLVHGEPKLSAGKELLGRASIDSLGVYTPHENVTDLAVLVGVMDSLQGGGP